MKGNLSEQKQKTTMKRKSSGAEENKQKINTIEDLV